MSTFSTPNNPQDPQKQSSLEVYEEALRVVKRIAPRYLDHHEIVMNVLLANNFTAPTKKLLKWRVVDAIRQHKNLRSLELLHERSFHYSDHDESSQKLFYDLLSSIHPTNLEKEILYLRFWKSQTLEQISQSLSLPFKQLQESLWLLMEKLKTAMRQREGLIEAEEEKEM